MDTWKADESTADGILCLWTEHTATKTEAAESHSSLKRQLVNEMFFLEEIKQAEATGINQTGFYLKGITTKVK